MYWVAVSRTNGLEDSSANPQLNNQTCLYLHVHRYSLHSDSIWNGSCRKPTRYIGLEGSNWSSSSGITPCLAQAQESDLIGMFYIGMHVFFDVLIDRICWDFLSLQQDQILRDLTPLFSSPWCNFPELYLHIEVPPQVDLERRKRFSKEENKEMKF